MGGVYSFVREYISLKHIELKGTLGEAYDVMRAVEGYGAWSFYNNFEVAHVPFFLCPEVQEFTKAVIDSQMIILRRWGDAVVRFFQVVLFATAAQIHCFNGSEITYSHGGF